MANQEKSKCKLCRRAGEKLFLKGDRCVSPKCAMVRKPYIPGAHGNAGGGRKGRGLSDFGKQLAEKQKLKRLYRVTEKQFKKHLKEAQIQSGVVGDNLVIRLESRLDNIIYRLGFAVSRAQARQLVSHSMFTVNGKMLNVPSAILKVGDEIALKSQKKEKTFFKELQTVLKKKKNVAGWLSFDANNMTAKVLATPSKDDLGTGVNISLVIEFYSR
ncbi:30S ribosomal protein S4 [bacterium]|jgi:small subunit ribosomal protein S4|nr:30S ribosomal protein S4 [bacterium]MBT4251342.1 30S ribosomal protein S4 [bacterium]MBT4598277.1 30S ribosomal protein S4 [bacterium]MBT6754110.1 30S ribosomal protein S4 [bacterium]MBT7037930.1 30S ribosomal protein S4 [bacterium]